MDRFWGTNAQAKRSAPLCVNFTNVPLSCSSSQPHQHQHERPSPIQFDAGWKFVIHFSISQGISISEVNVSRAKKLTFSRLLFLMMLSIQQSNLFNTYTVVPREPGKASAIG